MDTPIKMKENLDLYSVLVMSVTSLVMSMTSHRGVDLYKILPNSDKFDEPDPDLMLSTPSSEYYSITDANNLYNITQVNRAL